MESSRVTARGHLSVLEKRFLAKVLAEEGQHILEDQTRVIDRHHLVQENTMRSKRTHKVAGASDNFSGKLTISFVPYLRFHDMKKRHRTNAQGKSVRSKRKQYHLYNRIIFGRFSEIQKRLRFGYTEEIREQLRQELKIELGS